jgi:hypothetical protein
MVGVPVYDSCKEFHYNCVSDHLVHIHEMVFY